MGRSKHRIIKKTDNSVRHITTIPVYTFWRRYYHADILLRIKKIKVLAKRLVDVAAEIKPYKIRINVMSTLFLSYIEDLLYFMESEIMGQQDIYSIVPEDKLDDTFIEERHRVLKFLKDNAGKFYSAAQLAKMFGYPMKGTQVELRHSITLLIETDFEPIVSTSQGFSYATHPNQLKFYIDSLRLRQQGMERRIGKLQQIYENQIHGGDWRGRNGNGKERIAEERNG